ncbi:MAG: hypothetical protein MJE66_15250 [Proteobacteria bacterium]|nr:hypothetical protein [Pseudomonadota bacterium]
MFIIGLLALLALGLGGRNAAASERDDEPSKPSPGATSGKKLVRDLAARGGLTERQTDFLVFVAYGESGLKPDVGLGNPALFPPGTRPNTRASQAAQEREAYAAAKAYAENLDTFEGCGHPASEYSFGSGGLFAFLPVYALDKFKGTPLVCASPFEVFDPPFAIAAAYGFARGLTQRSAYLGTVASLRSGWGLPKKIGDLERIERKGPKWRRQLRELGFPESMLDSEAPSFPRRDLVAMYRAMGGRL